MNRPSRWTRLVSALRLIAGGAALRDEEREMREEMRFHLDKHIEKNIAAGMTPDAARRAAAVAFGGQAQWAEAARDEIRSRPLDDLARDLRYGVRAFRRNPGFSMVATLTLSLGIAATVTVYSFVDAIYWRPLPVSSSDALVRVYVAPASGEAGRAGLERSLGYAGYATIRDRVPAFDHVVAHYSTAPLYVSAGNTSFEVQGAVVSASYFPALGLRPSLGRFFTAAEDAVPDRDFVAVIGYGLWQSRFGGDTGVIGQTISVNGRTFAIVGVGPRDFASVIPTSTVNELWIPAMMLHVGYRWCDGFQPSCSVMDVIARLAPGATVEQARAQLAPFAIHLAALAEPTDSLQPLAVVPALGVSPAQRRSMTSLAQLLSAIGIMLLMIACANVAGLLVARGLARQVEIGVRMSLGAGRWRIVRQLLAESLVIAVAGGVVGVGLSVLLGRALAGFFTTDSEGYVHVFEISPNVRVVAFATGLSVATAILLGLVPALDTVRAGATSRLRGRGGSAAGVRTRTLLVTMQTAVCLMLLVGAGLLVRSFGRVTSQQNLNSSHVAVFRLRPRLAGYDAPRAQEFLHRVVPALASLPEVKSVAFARGVGLAWDATGRLQLSLPGEIVTKDKPPRPLVGYHEVSPGFFRTLEVPLAAGREFTDRDVPDAPHVAIVNESLARQLGRESVVGRTVLLEGKPFQVVGIVGDYRAHTALEPSPPMAFVPFWQNDFGPQIDARFAIRVQGDAAAALPAIRRAIAAVDPVVPMTESMAMTSQVAGHFADVNLGAQVMIAAAAFALFLSGIGLYGVVAFVVQGRTREVGIRIAVGAEPRSVTGLFVRQGMRPMAMGSIAGVVGSLLLAKPVSHWLYGVSPTDVGAYATAMVAVGVVAVVASYLPARRAARIDPVSALRSE
jgi:putative ABC transport system permease protein